MRQIEELRAAIRSVPDFPQKGILFRDITPILRDGKKLAIVIDIMASRYRHDAPTAIIGIESRGFIFGSILAREFGAGFVPVRKKGKLPHKTYEASYSLEYGSATLEIHQDALASGDRVVIVDDLLATGGTAGAAIELVNKFGAKILGLEFLVELKSLNGREKLKGYSVNSILTY